MKPIFLLAPMNRSGTKFLKSVILTHSRVSQGFSLEDYSLAYSDNLMRYAEYASRHWGRNREEKAFHRNRLIKEFGKFLLDFFGHGAEPADYLLLATPRPWGAKNVFHIFPDARVIFLIRDGRDCVESARKTWGGNNRYWTSEWCRGAREIVEFAHDHMEKQHINWDMLSFEELVRSPRAVADRLCGFLDLSRDGFDWEALENIPVKGSSLHGGPGSTLRKPDGFNPIGRSGNWSPLYRAFFAMAADRYVQQLKEFTTASVLAPDWTRSDDPAARVTT